MKKMTSTVLSLLIFLPSLGFAKTIQCLPTGEGANLVNKLSAVISRKLKPGHMKGYMIITSQSVYFGKTRKIGSFEKNTMFYDLRTGTLTAYDDTSTWALVIPTNIDQLISFKTNILHTPSGIDDIYSQQLSCTQTN